jgi:hypothetical protein
MLCLTPQHTFTLLYPWLCVPDPPPPPPPPPPRPPPHPPPQTPLTFPQHSHTLTQVDSITDSNQGLLLDVAEGRELPKAEAENLQKRRKLIKLE